MHVRLQACTFADDPVPFAWQVFATIIVVKEARAVPNILVVGRQILNTAHEARAIFWPRP